MKIDGADQSKRSMIAALALSVFLAGCATGYNRGEMDAALTTAKPVYVSSELSVEEIESIKPQLKLPARVAVAPPAQTYRGWSWRNSSNTWTAEEIAVIESWEEPLRNAGVVEDLFILPASLVKECQYHETECRLKAQRAAAARTHADALLIINLATATDEYVNPSSFLYLSIVGMWFVPGSHRDALTIAEGVLIDNRNEYLYAFARGEGENRSVGPSMYVDTQTSVKLSRIEALKNFGKEFIKQAGQLSVE